MSRHHPMNNMKMTSAMKSIAILLLVAGFCQSAGAQSTLRHVSANYYQAPGYAELVWFLDGRPIPARVTLHRAETGRPFQRTDIEVFVRAKGDTLMYTFSDSTLQRYNLYSYYLEAYDDSGKVVAAPDTVFLPALDYLEMPMPSSISAIGDSSTKSIKIAWNLPLGDLIKQMTLYRSTNSVDGFEQIATLDPRQLEFVDQEVRPATPYFYYFDLEYKMSDVKKRSASFASSFVSNEPPPIPDYFDAEATDNGIVLRWEHSDPDTRGFWLYRAQQGKPHELMAPLVPAIDTIRTYEFVDIDSLNPSLSYEYSIRAYSKSHITGASSDTLLIIPVSPMAPIPAPLNLVASPDVDQIFLQWQDMESSYPDFLLYRILRTSESETDTLYASLNYMSDTTAVRGIAYTYRVSTVNRQYVAGPPTGGVIALIPFEPPSPPYGLTLRATTSGVHLVWSTVNERQSVAYEVFRVVRGEAAVLIARVTDGMQYTDSTATRGETYFYHLVAISADGIRSEPSDEIRIRF